MNINIGQAIVSLYKLAIGTSGSDLTMSRSLRWPIDNWKGVNHAVVTFTIDTRMIALDMIYVSTDKTFPIDEGWRKLKP